MTQSHTRSDEKDLDTEAEDVTLHLLSRLEQLSTENSLLKSSMHDTSRQNDFLQTRLTGMDSQLEEAQAEIEELGRREELCNSNHAMSNDDSKTDSTQMLNVTMATPQLTTKFESLDQILKSNNDDVNDSDDGDGGENREEGERYGYDGNDIGMTNLPPPTVTSTQQQQRQAISVNRILNNDDDIGDDNAENLEETQFFATLRKKTLLAENATETMSLQNINDTYKKKIIRLENELKMKTQVRAQIRFLAFLQNSSKIC